jgi:hypothetical protein
MVNALCCKPEGREFKTQWGEFFSNLPNPSALLDPGGHSASNGNEHQNQKK